MRNRNIFLYVHILIFMIIQNCFSQKNTEITTDKTTNEWCDTWITLSDKAKIIDRDDESIWSYTKAKKIFLEAKKEKNVF